jgi:hypothetical protein
MSRINHGPHCCCPTCMGEDMKVERQDFERRLAESEAARQEAERERDAAKRACEMYAVDDAILYTKLRTALRKAGEALEKVKGLAESNIKVSFNGERTTRYWLNPESLLFVRDVLALPEVQEAMREA